MTREVTHEATGPKPLTEDDLGDDGAAYICQCGLSSDGIFCDGSHNATADEADGVRYVYEGDTADGERREIAEIVYANE
jgi:CDGSH-type Zn-finger protein